MEVVGGIDLGQTSTQIRPWSQSWIPLRPIRGHEGLMRAREARRRAPPGRRRGRLPAEPAAAERYSLVSATDFFTLSTDFASIAFSSSERSSSTTFSTPFAPMTTGTPRKRSLTPYWPSR
jgi:hypothetical protein